MKDKVPSSFSRRTVLFEAFRYSIPVLLGYVTIGVAFGLMLTGEGHPWWLALTMSLWMYAGAGQFIAAGLFAAGTTLWEVCLVQLVVNARHIAYGLSMLKRFRNFGPLKPYLIFSLTDETFALLSSLPANGGPYADDGEVPEKKRRFFIFYVALLDQCYWVSGTVIGAIAGTLIPFDMKGIGFALTALFVVLMIEQIKRHCHPVKKPGLFIVSGAAALAGVFFVPASFSLLAALALALLFSPIVERNFTKGRAM